MSTSKPRGDAKLKLLPDALQEELFQFLRRATIAKTITWLSATHGVDTSPAALSEFFSWYPRQGWLKQAATFADDLKATVKKLPELKLSAEQAEQVAQVSFELQAAQNRDSKLFLALQKGKLNRYKAGLEERRVVILEKKAAIADQAEAITANKDLTDEEKAQHMRSLFGMG